MAEIPKSSFEGPLAPKFGLTDNARDSFPLKDAPEPKRRNYSSLIPVAGIAIAILVIPLTLQQINQQQDVRQQASEPTPTIQIAPSVTPAVSEAPTSTASPSLSPSVSQEERGRSFDL